MSDISNSNRSFVGVIRAESPRYRVASGQWDDSTVDSCLTGLLHRPGIKEATCSPNWSDFSTTNRVQWTPEGAVVALAADLVSLAGDLETEYELVCGTAS